MSQDHAKLKYLFGLIKPALVLVQDGPAFEKALKALDSYGVTVVHVARPAGGIAEHRLRSTSRRPRLRAMSRIRLQRSRRNGRKIPFTSGSTAMPKAVITTQRMLCANSG